MENLISTSDYEKLTKEQLIEYVESLENLIDKISDRDSIVWALTNKRSGFTFTHKYRCDMIQNSAYRIYNNMRDNHRLEVLSYFFPLPKEKIFVKVTT